MDITLSEQDERIALAYKSALQAVRQPDELRARQREWLRMLAMCKDRSCIGSAQDLRLAQLGGEPNVDWAPTARVGGAILIQAHVSITIMAVRGIGSARAAIDARMIEQNAVAACRGYLQEAVPTRRCIAEWMREGGGGQTVEYRADCTTGLFRVGAGSFAFLGRNAAASPGSIDQPGYLIRDKATGEFLEAMSASGYDVALSAFETLCPGAAERSSRVRQ